MKTKYICDYCRENLIFVEETPEEEQFLQICIVCSLLFHSTNDPTDEWITEMLWSEMVWSNYNKTEFHTDDYTIKVIGEKAIFSL